MDSNRAAQLEAESIISLLHKAKREIEQLRMLRQIDHANTTDRAIGRALEHAKIVRQIAVEAQET